MGAIAYYCECKGRHEPGCPLLLRLEIKERICKERGIAYFVPEAVAQEIDEAVEKALQERHD